MSSHNQAVFSPILAGRTTDVEALRHWIAQAHTGKGVMVLIAGEAGIGKSRLLNEARAMATQSGFVTLQGNCFEPDHALPYAPLLDLLRSAQREVELPADLAALVAGQRAETDTDPEQAKRGLSASVSMLLTDPKGFLKPLGSKLIILEDLHWCDDLSLEFLMQFARAISAQPILVLLTYRNDEISPKPFALSDGAGA